MLYHTDRPEEDLQKITIKEIEDKGFEAGCTEACDHWPWLYDKTYQELRQHGRARAQGLYELRGRAAKVFAQEWARGYEADCRVLREFHEEDEDGQETEQGEEND